MKNKPPGAAQFGAILMRSVFLAGFACTWAASACAQVNVVHGDLITLTNTPTAPNGAWSWFEDERAIIDARDPGNVLLLVSSVSSAPNGDPESGDIDLLWANLNTGQQGESELANQLERDDHDSAALYIRPDGRYLAIYSKHGSDQLTRWRISTNPHDPTNWQPEQSISAGAGATYNNIHYMPGDDGGAGRTYNFTRATNYDPVVQVSSDDGSTWSVAGKLLTQGGGGDRPYLKYASDGDKIHFIATEEHPRDFLNSIYHGYVKDGVLYDAAGTVRDNTIFDAAGISPTVLTPVFKNGTQVGGTTMNRAWTTDLELDNTGNPVGIFTVRANDSSLDHRFFYARFDGAQWQVNEMARAGGYLYAAENDYTGLASVDPNNPNVVYMSSPIKPGTNEATSKYELYKGVTSDFGQTWSWSAITENSTMDNLRPVVPRWNGQQTAIAWMRGTYTTYTNWTTDIVALTQMVSDPKSLLWRGNSGGASTWEVDGISNWNSGGGSVDPYQNGDEVAFDDTAQSFQIHIPAELSPMGVAFNNSAQNYTLTGAGISGSGRLRIIGGGTVTLANATNTFTGETHIHRGKLVITGSATLSGSAQILIGTGGILDVAAVSGGSYILNNQSLAVEGQTIGNILASNGSTIHVESSGAIRGDVVAESGSAVRGSGRIEGNLTAESSSFVRVGAAGLAAQYTDFTYIDATAGPSGNTALASGEAFSPTPSATASGTDHLWRGRTSVGNSGTVFESGGDISSAGSSNGGNNEDAPRLITTISGLAAGSTYAIEAFYWDTTESNDHWRLQASLTNTAGDLPVFADNDRLANTLTYTSPPLLSESNRRLYAAGLGTAVADASGRIVVYVDDDPAPRQGVTNGWQYRTWYDGVAFSNTLLPVGETLSVEGNVTMYPGSVLELDLVGPAHHDLLLVRGQFTAGGTLKVSLAAGAPAPQAGDAFQILDFGSVGGAFDAFQLPSLNAGLAWSTSNLLTSGVLEVIVAGDHNGDGVVDAADYVVWRKTGSGEQQGYDAWRSSFGAITGTASSVTAAIVPEPSAVIVSIGSTLLICLYRNVAERNNEVAVHDHASI